MANKERLIYANEVIDEIDEIIGNINFSSPYQNDNDLIVEGLERARYCVMDAPTVDAVPIDDIKLHHILIDQNGIPEVKLQFGERTIILRREGDPVDVRVFVNGQWRTVYDDSAGWVNECSKCKEFGDGTPYCSNCGAKMDGEQNG